MRRLSDNLPRFSSCWFRKGWAPDVHVSGMLADQSRGTGGCSELLKVFLWFWVSSKTLFDTSEDQVCVPQYDLSPVE